MNEDQLRDLLRRCLTFLREHKQGLDDASTVESACLRIDIVEALDDSWLPRKPSFPWGRPPP